MSMTGAVLLALATAGLFASALLALAAGFRVPQGSDAQRCLHGAPALSRFACALLALGMGLVVWCLVTGDNSLRYAAYYRSDSTSDLAPLFRLSGLWSGREGSLLLWAWLESLAGSVVLSRISSQGNASRLDILAAAFLLGLAALFSAVVLLVPGNQLFAPMPSEYLDATGNLVGQAQLWGLSSLLEHWAMAVHPPLLFVGYAGLTVPAVYAGAALVVGDGEEAWTRRCRRWALGGWLFLTLGIGLGAVWAYTVLGWGGFWGWDPVENASFLPWLAGVVLVHHLMAASRRDLFPRWTLAAALLTFAFVMFAAFITRSGIIGSVHAFDGDSTSAWLFGLLATVPLAAGGAGLAVRWRCFGAGANEEGNGDANGSGGAGIASLASKEGLIYLGDLVMIGFAFLLAYLILAPALPSRLPFAGRAFSSEAYATIADPLGIVYLALVAAVPVFGWRKTSWHGRSRALAVQLAVAAAIFALLMAVFLLVVLPGFHETDIEMGTVFNEQLAAGMPWPRPALAVAGFLVASLLFATSLTGLVRAARARRIRAAGASVAHGALPLILIGLVGSTLYVTQESFSLPYDERTGTSSESIELGPWGLTSTGTKTVIEENRTDLFSTAFFDVSLDGRPMGFIAPQVQLIATTQQHQLHAAVVSTPLEDLFVTYQGVDEVGDEKVLVVDVGTHPLVAFVWAGFILLLFGMALATFAPNGKERRWEHGR